MKTVWRFTEAEQRAIHMTALRRREYHQRRGTPVTRAAKGVDPLRLDTIGVAAEWGAKKMSAPTEGRFPITVDRPDIGIDGVWGGATWQVKGSDLLWPTLVIAKEEMVADAVMVFAVGWPPGDQYPSSARFAGWLDRYRWFKNARSRRGYVGFWVGREQLLTADALFDWLGLKVAQ